MRINQCLLGAICVGYHDVYDCSYIRRI